MAMAKHPKPRESRDVITKDVNRRESAPNRPTARNALRLILAFFFPDNPSFMVLASN